MEPLTVPATRPTVLLTLATTGEKPNASKVGKVMSEPEPTMVLTVPATKPVTDDSERFEHGHGEGLPEWRGSLNTTAAFGGRGRHRVRRREAPDPSPGHGDRVAVAPAHRAAPPVERGVARADHPGAGALGALPGRIDLGGLRARGDPGGPGPGRCGRTASHPAHHRGHRRPPGHPGAVVPAGHRRLSRAAEARMPSLAPTWGPTPATWRQRR